MRTKHLNNTAIQQFAFEPSTCVSSVKEHIDICSECMEEMNSYRLLSDALKELPEPILDFDISRLVLDKIQSRQKEEHKYSWFINLVLSLGIVAPTLILLFFKESITDLFINISAQSNYFMISVAILITIILAIDMLKTYGNKNRILEFNSEYATLN